MQSALDPKHLPVMSSSPVNLEPTMSPISSTLTTEQKGQSDLHSSGCSTGLVLGLLYTSMADSLMGTPGHFIFFPARESPLCTVQATRHPSGRGLDPVEERDA